jgi:hypothetical protein
LKIKQQLPIYYGVGGGIAGIIFYIIIFFSGNNFLLQFKFLDIFLLIIFSILGIIHFKRTTKQLLFKEGFQIGFVGALINSAITSLFLYLFLIYSPDILSGYVNEQIKNLFTNKGLFTGELGQKAFTETLQNVKNTTAGIMALDNIIRKMLIAFLFVTLTSVLIRTQKNQIPLKNT